MPAATSPIFSRLGDIQWGVITGSNTAKDGTGTVVTVWTADATNGGFLDQIRIIPAGTNAPTVMRFFVNNGSSNATAANNSLVGEAGLPGTTISESAANSPIPVVPVGVAFPPGYKLNVTLGTAVAAGWSVTCIGGKY